MDKNQPAFNLSPTDKYAVPTILNWIDLLLNCKDFGEEQRLKAINAVRVCKDYHKYQQDNPNLVKLPDATVIVQSKMNNG